MKDTPALWVLGLDFASLLLASLVAGVMFCVWLVANPSGIDSVAYVSHQQRLIRALNVTMPVFGLATVVSTVAAAITARTDSARLALFVVGIACFVVAALITRFANQPINALVMSWSPDRVPSNWGQLRDKWWRWHVIRTAAGLCGLSALIIAALKP